MNTIFLQYFYIGHIVKIYIQLIYGNSPQITSKAHKHTRGNTSTSFPSKVSSFSAKTVDCLLKTSTNCSRILKWKVGVMIFLLVCHLLPLLTNNPSPSHLLRKLYSSDFSLNFGLLRITSTSFGSIRTTCNVGPKKILKVFPYSFEQSCSTLRISV